MSYMGLSDLVGLTEDPKTPPCHLWHMVPMASPDKRWTMTAEAIRQNVSNCENMARCSVLRFCSEYHVRKSTMFASFHPVTLPRNMTMPNGVLNTIVVVYPEKQSVIEEYTTATVGNYLGTVGGIVGIFVGASFLSCIGMVQSAVKSTLRLDDDVEQTIY